MSLSTVTAAQAANACIVAALLVFGVWAVRYCYRRARAEDARCDQIIRETLGDRVGPNDPRLPAGINALLDDYAALDEDLAPVFAPGLDRLRQAIRDEQNKGD
jgi:hypothetical protein